MGKAAEETPEVRAQRKEFPAQTSPELDHDSQNESLAVRPTGYVLVEMG
jgi:hypothetical protein